MPLNEHNNILPIRIRLPRRITVGDLVRQTSRSMREALRHQRYRYEDMRRDLGAQWAGSELFGPIVNVMGFVLETPLDDLECAVHPLPSASFEDLSILVHWHAEDETINVAFHGCSDRYSEVSNTFA